MNVDVTNKVAKRLFLIEDGDVVSADSALLHNNNNILKRSFAITQDNDKRIVIPVWPCLPDRLSEAQRKEESDN